MTPATVLQFLQQQKLGVLSTVSPEGKPEAALVGIAVTEKFELIFDTINTTRKYKNLQYDPRVAFVIGLDKEITVQYEGIADKLSGDELARLQKVYFEVYPDGPSRLNWPGITYFRVRPSWIRYSDYNEPVRIVEFDKDELNA